MEREPDTIPEWRAWIEDQLKDMPQKPFVPTIVCGIGLHEEIQRLMKSGFENHHKNK